MTETPDSGALKIAEELALILKAAGDELRLEILRALSTDSFGVLELCALFEVKQSGMSHHLKVLANAQLVTKRKEGNSIFYRRSTPSHDDPNAQLKQAIFKSVDQIPLKDDNKRNLDGIYTQRSIASKKFFSENATQFKQQQDLISEFDVYGLHVAESLQNSSIEHRRSALEVGPGAGEFLAILAKQFDHVIALDNSAEMLAESQKRCKTQNISNIDYIHNDTSHCRDIKNSIDCAVINMVLHHTPSPQKIFQDVSHALKPNGIILICDLCQHDQDWTKEACGDLWLGFAPEDLSRWAAGAGFQEGQSSYFALRNGFQIQIREFIKN